MGRLWRATPPMMTMTSDSTVAKTGRSTKKRANMARSYEAAFGGAAAAGGPGRMLTFCGVTVAPGRARWIPFTITHSPGARPSATARSAPWRGPSFTGRYSTTFFSLTTRTYFRSWSVPIARSVTRMPGRGSPTGTRTRTKSPGVSSRSGLGSTARTWIVPVDGSIWLSMKSIVPWWRKSFSSASATRTGAAAARTFSGAEAPAPAGRAQHLVAGHLGLRAGELRTQPGDLPLGAEDRRLVFARVDLEEEVTRLDERAVGERDLRDVAGHARPYLDAVDGADPACEFERLLDRLLDRLAHRNLGRGRRDHLRLAAASGAGSRDRKQTRPEHQGRRRPPSVGYHCGLHHRQRHQPRSCSVPVLAACAMLRCSFSASRSPQRVRA